MWSVNSPPRPVQSTSTDPLVRTGWNSKECFLDRLFLKRFISACMFRINRDGSHEGIADALPGRPAAGGLAGAALEDIRRRQQFDCAVAQAPVIWNANYLLSFNTVAAPSCCSGG